MPEGFKIEKINLAYDISELVKLLRQNDIFISEKLYIEQKIIPNKKELKRLSNLD
jgi:hypothetical protein